MLIRIVGGGYVFVEFGCGFNVCFVGVWDFGCYCCYLRVVLGMGGDCYVYCVIVDDVWFCGWCCFVVVFL